MKTKISRAASLTSQTFSAFALSTLVFQLNTATAQASDFSKAKHVYVAPSEIRYDLDALETNSWTFPGLDANTKSSINPDTPTAGRGGPGIGTMLSGSEGAAGSQSGQVIFGSSGNAFHAPFNYSGKNGWQKYQNSLSTSVQIAKLNTKINALRHSGNLAQAEALSRDGLRYFPNNATLKRQFVEITTLESQHSLAASDFDSAGIKCREALACDPTYKPAQIVDNKVLQSQGLDPNNADVRVTVGDNLANDGRVLEALVEYRRSLNIKSNAPAHVGLGNLAFGKGLISETTRQYERALAIDPQCSIAYRQRGALRYVMHDAVGANSDFNKALSLNPNDRLAGEALVGLWKQLVANDSNSINGHLGLARAYLMTNNLEAARAEYKTVATLDPNNPALPQARTYFKMALARQQAYQNVQAAQTLDSQGALTEANQKVAEAVSLYPNDPQILLYQGQLNEKMGLTAQAHDIYMSVLKVDPNNLEAARRLKALSPGLSASAGALPAPAPPLSTANQSSSLPTAPPPAMPMFTAPPLVAPAQSSIFPSTTPYTNTQPSTPTVPQGDPINNAPLKAPLQKSEAIPSTESIPSVDLFALDRFATENDISPQVIMLSNFGSAVRRVILNQKMLLQLAKEGSRAKERSCVSQQ